MTSANGGGAPGVGGVGRAPGAAPGAVPGAVAAAPPGPVPGATAGGLAGAAGATLAADVGGMAGGVAQPAMTAATAVISQGKGRAGCAGEKTAGAPPPTRRAKLGSDIKFSRQNKIELRRQSGGCPTATCGFGGAAAASNHGRVILPLRPAHCDRLHCAADQTPRRRASRRHHRACSASSSLSWMPPKPPLLMHTTWSPGRAACTMAATKVSTLSATFALAPSGDSASRVLQP